MNKKSRGSATKYLIASDLHGSVYYVSKLVDRIESESPDKIILLGDILYHGPRNDLPHDYLPKDVVTLLTPYAERIVCVRGNCDAEVDMMVLPFGMRSHYVFRAEDRLVYCTHGHRYGEHNVPISLLDGSILLTGHTHVVANRYVGGVRYLNPGSISIPKSGTPRGYIVYEDGVFSFRDLEGVEYDRYETKSTLNR